MKKNFIITTIILVSLIFSISLRADAQGFSAEIKSLLAESFPLVPEFSADYSLPELKQQDLPEEPAAISPLFLVEKAEPSESLGIKFSELYRLKIDAEALDAAEQSEESWQELLKLEELEAKEEAEAAEAETQDEKEKKDEREGWGPFFRDEGIVHAELPGESELNVSGRKFVKFNFNYTDYINDPERSSSSDLAVDQQLQVRVRGSVFDEQLTIEIDYDDSLPEVDRQRTRVYYDGREYDLGFAQFKANAQFGDIRLSLPGTNFVSYNKQVFGLSADARFSAIDLGIWGLEEMRFYAIASQQKGKTQKKVFEGSNQRRIPEPVADIHPVRRTY
ncbi:MAG: hypothetical protein ACLFN5_00060 [bacterium]